MQADVLPLLTFDVDLDFRFKSLLFMGFWCAIFYGSNFHDAIHNIVGRPRRHTLGKFAPMIGKELPVRTLFPQGMHFHLDSIERVVIRPISSAEDKSIILFQILAFTGV
jgi:hypothetical protein